MANKLNNITFDNFKWLNEPAHWSLSDNVLMLRTDREKDFWQETWYNFNHNSGHVYGTELSEDFTVEICVEADFKTLYDQAGLMLYVDEKNWVKAGIEYTDGLPMISSVVTKEFSDWGTGVFTGNPNKFWMKLTKVGNVVCIKYSIDNETWLLLRLCLFPVSEKYFVGPMSCTPTREGLTVKFSGLKFSEPVKDILHSD
ncbi:regulation of enolase protein 1-like [Melitaea cinxia]|uniref:regulation of enolase protein 1-like n=1 Tax=Melitaea cinxia TaxID=113334 RepID=UPI001E271EAE|nr:regulation of enolase protein 1-like [Melitaea cinxia]